MMTILQLKVAKRRLFEKVSLELCEVAWSQASSVVDEKELIKTNNRYM